MKAMIIGLAATLFIAGCTTAPSSHLTPKPAPNKYTIQVIGIAIPDEALQSCQNEVDRMLQHPAAMISDYPIVTVGVGESATHDQTTSIPAEIDGMAVSQEKECRPGYAVSVKDLKMVDDAISYHLTTHYEELKGYEKYTSDDGSSVMVPYSQKREIDTQITQHPNTWLMLGGVMKKGPNGENINLMICVRAIPAMTEE